MILYESFFILILISILGPVLGFFILIFFTGNERQVHFLEMENRQVMLEKELEISRYLELNQQIQPHFLFNALNSLLGLIRLKQYDRLSSSFEHMVMYLRSKYTNKDPLYPLENEISYTKNYLEIQKLRFGERLKIDWEIEEGIEDVAVIPYLLQTLVENAFKHGLEMIEGEGILSIRLSFIHKERVMLEVEDNGPGFLIESEQISTNENKIGLQNIRRRLSLLFEDKAEVTTANRSIDGGAVVKVTWPAKLYQK